jgi:hypothetical protein
MERNAERDQQAAEQDRVRERVGRRLELPPVFVDGGERTPERIARAAMQLRGNRLEQADFGKLPERFLGRSRAQNLVVLLESRGSELFAISCRCLRIACSSVGSIVKSSRAAIAIARIIRTGSSFSRTSGSPMERTIPERRSSSPPT